MPVKRRQAKVKDHRITADAIEAFRAGDAVALDRALGIRPWEVSPMDADTDDPPEWAGGSAWAQSWPVARELRLELERRR